MSAIFGSVGAGELLMVLFLLLLFLVPTFGLCFLPTILGYALKRDYKRTALLANIALVAGTLPAAWLAGLEGEVVIALLWFALIVYIIVKKPIAPVDLPPAVE